VRILFGGSFDPVHDGHIRTALALRQLTGCPAVYLLPAACSPLKKTVTADHHRLAMLELAVAGEDGLLIDSRELQRPPPSYTIDTLLDIRREAGTTESLAWVVGSDSLQFLCDWKDWQRICTLAHLIVIDRPGWPWPASGPVAGWLASLPACRGADQLHYAPCGQLLRLSLPPQPFSSTDIRAALARGSANTTRPAGLHEGVWRYINDHHLYRNGNTAEDA